MWPEEQCLLAKLEWRVNAVGLGTLRPFCGENTEKRCTLSGEEGEGLLARGHGRDTNMHLYRRETLFMSDSCVVGELTAGGKYQTASASAGRMANEANSRKAEIKNEAKKNRALHDYRTTFFFLNAGSDACATAVACNLLRV